MKRIISYVPAILTRSISDIANQSVLQTELTPEEKAGTSYYPGGRTADNKGLPVFLTKVGQVDGARGHLYFRGIPIERIVETHDTFEAVTGLLLTGEPVDTQTLETLTNHMKDQDFLSPRIRKAIECAEGLDVMATLGVCVTLLKAEDDGKTGLSSSFVPAENFLKGLRLIAQLPYIIAYAHHQQDSPDVPFQMASPDQSIAEGFLTMLRGTPPTKTEVDVLNMCLILHAEHGGGNNSSATTRVVSSARTDIYQTMSAAIASLSGPLHGGASEATRNMVEYLESAMPDGSWEGKEDELRGKMANIIRGTEYPEGGKKLYGMGHAVYKVRDPRAAILEGYARQLAQGNEALQTSFEHYEMIDKQAASAFQEAKGKPNPMVANVDFWSNFIYHSLGIPPTLYTPMFAMARSAGWASHRLEAVSDKLFRPAALYVG